MFRKSEKRIQTCKWLKMEVGHCPDSIRNMKNLFEECVQENNHSMNDPVACDDSWVLKEIKECEEAEQDLKIGNCLRGPGRR